MTSKKQQIITASQVIEIPANRRIIPIFPPGTSKTVDGRGPFINDDPEAVIKASMREHVLPVIDRDHGADLLPKGTPNPAAGWITRLFAEDGWIKAEVEWTPAAELQIENKEYRYISPTFDHEKSTGRVKRIRRATLTNTPALDMMSLASEETDQSTQEENDPMNKHLLALASALALTTTSFKTDEDVAKAAEVRIKELTDDATSLASIRKGLKVADDAGVEVILSTASEKKTDVNPNDYVPMTQFKLLQTELASIQNEGKAKKAEEAVNKAVEDGKLLPAQKEWALSYASQDLDGFSKFIENSHVMTKPAGIKGAKPNASGDMSDDDIALCAQLGVSQEDYQKTAKELAAE
ncbi:MAG: hypothetical protein DI551_08245 [Micavibrio aeruginosavorus]|uniref:Uncharacterized protein n=1 Tax=Micavibrio aeruginosavorus TaxID=349221 RepID=A0A2W5MXV2_9BACT|nr:MAG: hypothetical protein DI551_08245 [Micavibrio aeruginosavorus]